MKKMLKLLKNKRAEREFWAADTWPFYLIFGIVVNLVFILFLLGINSNELQKSLIHEGLEEFTVTTGLFYSKDCFLYSENNIARALIIDWNKFTNDNLNKCVAANNPYKLNLKINNEQKEIKTKNWKDNTPSKRREPVKHIIVFKDSKFMKGELSIELQ